MNEHEEAVNVVASMMHQDLLQGAGACIRSASMRRNVPRVKLNVRGHDELYGKSG